MDRFSALPNEILDLISGEVQDPKNLFYLSLVSKNCYHVFNRRLYESVKSEDKQIDTVALLENERIPLIGPHPASFVKTLELTLLRLYPASDMGEEERQEQETIRENSFRRQADSALNNVAKHAALRRLSLRFPKIHLHEVLGKLNSTKFGNLRQLVIRCIVEQQSLDIFESLCRSSPTLNYLEVYGFNDTSEAIARLLEVIPKACPNLKGIRMPSFYPKSCEPIQRVLDDPDFTFPLLHDCGYFMQCNALKLLERHPKIEKLSVFKVNIGEPSFKAPLGLLPNLRHFCGHISDYFKLCTEYAPPLECLDIDMLFNPEEERTLVSELANTKTLRQLSLTGYALSLLLFAWITRACPKLTHFKCTLGREKSLDFIFQTVLHDLPDLEHLKLQFVCASVLEADMFNNPGYYSHRVQASLHPLKTLEIDILLTSAKRIYFYFMKDNNRIISVPELDANRFDWFNFV